MRRAEVLVEGDEIGTELVEHLCMTAAGAALAAVVVPAAVVRLGDFEADIGLDDAGDGRELIAKSAAGILGIVRRLSAFSRALMRSTELAPEAAMMSRVMSLVRACSSGPWCRDRQGVPPFWSLRTVRAVMLTRFLGE